MNVKPGDLAIIIGCANKKYDDTIGRIVSIVEKSLKYQDSWIIEFSGDRPKSLRSDSQVSAPDYRLRPVSGLPDTEHTDEREPIKELA